MMRMAGIPARVVTGYMGGWYNDVGNYMLVRQSDAHAWSEVWFAGTGWTRVDPTAAVSPLRVEQGSLGAITGPRHLFDYEWLREIRNGVDIVQQRWNDWVIEFGAAQQSRLFSSLGMERLSPVMLVTALFIVIAIASVILVPLVFRVKGPNKRDPLKVIWLTFIKRLEGAGFEVNPSNGAIEMAQAASRRLPDDAGTIQLIADLYNRHRYSPAPPDLQDIKDAIKQFRPKKPSK
jgi:hypothetical protein